MHLTNYSVNKYNDAFVKTSDEDPGSKRFLNKQNTESYYS